MLALFFLPQQLHLNIRLALMRPGSITFTAGCFGAAAPCCRRAPNALERDQHHMPGEACLIYYICTAVRAQ